MRIDDRALAMVRVMAAALAFFSIEFDSGAPAALRLLLEPGTYGLLLAVFFGYRTRYAALVAWLLISLSGVLGLAALDAGVAGLIALLTCLRCSHAWSFDSALNWVGEAGGSPLNWGSVVYLTQLVLVVVAAQLHDGDANLVVVAVASGMAVILLLPPAVLEALARWSARYHGNELQIYYDRDCGFCLKTCLLFRTFLLLGDTPIRAAQSDPKIGRILEEQNSWVVIDRDGSIALHWHAVLLVMRRSLIARPVGLALTAVGMGRWGRGLYDAIGNSRGVLSKFSAAVLPYRSEEPQQAADWHQFAIVWLIASLASNIFSKAVAVATAIGLVVITA